MAQQPRGPFPPLRQGTPGGKGSDPTYHAGRGGGGSDELVLGLRTRPARTVQVMVPADSGSPPPRLGTPARARPPRGRLRAQAGAPRPPRAEVAAGPAPRLKGRRLTGPRLRGPGGRLRGEAWGPALSSPSQPTRPLPPPPRASLLAPAPEPPASTARPPATKSPNAPEVASARRPHSAAAGLRRWNRTNPESSGASRGSRRRAGPHLTAPTGPALLSRPSFPAFSGLALCAHSPSVHAGQQPS
ncbi:hypothetical protein P7K49_023223 [Saguinus oedipus]|uniref:Basic proline-rich protein-like n=1 Tax=Saguinus oedipus TaxID=9490 RepID=A0ABQ9UL08_SAGOE|nr:hypothetical protein P7K49_023223 [Saguinus oedipus]